MTLREVRVRVQKATGQRPTLMNMSAFAAVEWMFHVEHARPWPPGIGMFHVKHANGL